MRVPILPCEPLPMPAKPSLTILPFVNLGADPGQDLFSDGLTLMDVKLVLGEAARLVSQSIKNTGAIESYYRGWGALFGKAASY